MATKTGNSYTTGTTTDSVEIPTASPGLSTMVSLNKVSPSDCDNDRQPEMAIWPPKPEIHISGTMADRMTIPTANLGLSTTPSAKKPRAIATTTDNRGNSNVNVLGSCLAILGTRSLSQSFG